MLMHFCHCVNAVHHKSGFQEVLAETDAVESFYGIIAMTLSGQWTYAMYALLFHHPSVLINDGASPTAAAVATPILKLCDTY